VAEIVGGDRSALKGERVIESRVASQLGAARLQHLYALRIRQALKSKNRSLKQFAADSGVGYDRMTKMLRGQALMRLEDIAAADHLLGPVGELARYEAEARRERAQAERSRDAADLESRRNAIQKELSDPEGRSI
jgi:transcriptional regulator with XRE-family HTH domain